MPVCYYCNGTARCANCGGTGTQFDGRTCSVCGGSGRCQHCVNGIMQDVAQPRMRETLMGSAALVAMIAVAAVPEAAQAQTTPPPNNCNTTTGTPVPPDIATCGPVLAILEPPAGETPRGIAVHGMSSDGRTVFGDFFRGGGNIVRWRDGVPTIVVPSADYPSGHISIRISRDGSTLVGYAIGQDLTPETRSVYQATYWTQATGFRYIPLPPNFLVGGYAADARAVSSDGSLILVNGESDTVGAVYLWSPVTGYRIIASHGPIASSRFTADRILGTAMSGDATMIAGIFQDCPNLCRLSRNIHQGAFVWNAQSGVTALPNLSNASYFFGLFAGFSDVNNISADGSTIVGTSVAADGNLQAVYWRNGQITGLGYLAGTTPADFQTIANAASANGSVIVGGTSDGSVSFSDSETGIAWRWTQATGMQNLNTFASGLGLSLGGWTLTEAMDVTANGNTILGQAYNGSLDRIRPFLLSITSIGVTTTTQSRLLVEVRLPDVTQQAIVNQTFQTRVRGTLNGVNISDSSFAGALTDPAGANAITNARNAIQLAAGLRRISISVPVLTGTSTVNSNPREATRDELISVATSLATVTTNGPGSVATGDRGTCATPAATNVNPTGCSLPGTTLTLGAGDTNINNYTNTTNTRQRTTTVSIDQVQTSSYAVNGTAGNQFGTAHALVGPATFEANDRLLAQLLARGAARDGSPPSMARTGAAMRDEMALGGEGGGLSLFGGGYGRWSSINADASVPVAKVKGDAKGFVLGIEKGWESGARLGLAVDHGSSDYRVRDPLFPERLDAKLTQLALYGGLGSGRFSLSAALSYGFGDVDTEVASPTGTARASRNLGGWGIGAQAGYDLIAEEAVELALVGGVRHSEAELKRFTETGGSTPLSGLASTTKRTRLFAGIEAATELGGESGAITPRFHARIAKDSGDRSGVADLVFASGPAGPAMQAFGPGTGRTVGELGASIEADIVNTVSLWAGYDGNFRSGAQTHNASVGLSVRW